MPHPFEEVAATLASTIYCGLGGLLWGCAAGAMARARAKHPIWRSALLTAAGAMAFEAIMRAKLAGYDQARRRSRAGQGRAGAAQAALDASSGDGMNDDSDRDGRLSLFTGDASSFGPLYGPPQYVTLRSFAFTTSLDLAASSLVLLAIIQPSRSPMAFGGWALGRLLMLSTEVEIMDVEYS